MAKLTISVQRNPHFGPILFSVSVQGRKKCPGPNAVTKSRKMPFFLNRNGPKIGLFGAFFEDFSGFFNDFGAFFEDFCAFFKDFRAFFKDFRAFFALFEAKIAIFWVIFDEKTHFFALFSHFFRIFGPRSLRAPAPGSDSDVGGCVECVCAAGLVSISNDIRILARRQF